MNLAWLFWDPDPIAFHIPYIDHPIAWYALCFVVGFIIAFWIFVPILAHKLRQLSLASQDTARSAAISYTDGLTWFIILGTLIGARLGHVFFYEWPRYKAHPLEIFKTWEGGLASHGGALGVMIAVFAYYKWRQKQYPSLTFLSLMDLLSIPVAFVAICIRLGNFMNQEILGTSTSLPWGILFGHPRGHIAEYTPLHPVQLYEAAAYALTFLILGSIWCRWKEQLPAGLLIGLFFTLIFGSRFILEFWKAPMGLMIDESFLQTGQYLSLPFIILGLLLIINSLRNYAAKN